MVDYEQHPSPFEHFDVATTTTHKSLRGPRAGMFFFKYSEAIPNIKERIDMAVQRTLCPMQAPWQRP